MCANRALCAFPRPGLLKTARAVFTVSFIFSWFHVYFLRVRVFPRVFTIELRLGGRAGSERERILNCLPATRYVPSYVRLSYRVLQRSPRGGDRLIVRGQQQRRLQLEQQRQARATNCSNMQHARAGKRAAIHDRYGRLGFFESLSGKTSPGKSNRKRSVLIRAHVAIAIFDRWRTTNRFITGRS